MTAEPARYRGLVAQRTIPVDEFEANCLALLDEVAETNETLVVTKRGKPVARIVPAEPPKGAVADEALDAGSRGPYGGRQAAALAPFMGKWVALASPTEVLVAADTPQEVLRWLARHDRRASYGMFRVPTSTAEAEGAAPL